MDGSNHVKVPFDNQANITYYISENSYMHENTIPVANSLYIAEPFCVFGKSSGNSNAYSDIHRDTKFDTHSGIVRNRLGFTLGC